jgi:hypothetical protein
MALGLESNLNQGQEKTSDNVNRALDLLQNKITTKYMLRHYMPEDKKMMVEEQTAALAGLLLKKNQYKGLKTFLDDLLQHGMDDTTKEKIQSVIENYEHNLTERRSI